MGNSQKTTIVVILMFLGLSCAALQPVGQKVPITQEKVDQIVKVATASYKAFQEIRGMIDTVESQCSKTARQCKEQNNKECIPLHTCILHHARLNEISNLIDSMLMATLAVARLGDFDRANGILQEVQKLIKLFKSEAIDAIKPMGPPDETPKLSI